MRRAGLLALVGLAVWAPGVEAKREKLTMRQATAAIRNSPMDPADASSPPLGDYGTIKRCKRLARRSVKCRVRFYMDWGDDADSPTRDSFDMHIYAKLRHGQVKLREVY